MAGVVVELGRTLTRNRRTAGKSAQTVVGATLGFAMAGATVLLAFIDVLASARLDLLALVLGLWLIGWIVAPSFTGGPELTGQYFRLHPIRRSSLTRGLFAAAWRSLPAMVALLAFAALVAVAAPLGPAAVVVSLPATVLSVAVLICASRLAAIWFAAVSRSRLGASASSLVTAAIIVVAQHSWIIVLAIIIHLETGLLPGLGTALRILPSSWGLVAVVAAGDGDWVLALTAISGLAVLGGLLYLLWMRFVTANPVRASLVMAPRRSRTPALGTVRAELLGSVRAPLRLQDIVLATSYAIGTCALPLIIGFGAMLPFTGVAAVIMGAATSSNLYGAAGTALWMTLLSPGTEATDVRGRQLAWLVVYGGIGAVLTVLGFALHPDPDLLPWVVGSFLAVLGAGAGLIAFLSVFALQPGSDPHTAKYSPAEQSDSTGPAFLAIGATLLLAAPTVGVLTAGQLTGTDTLLWAGIAVGVLTAVLAPWLLGTSAIRRLRARGPELMHQMRSGAERQQAVAGAPAGAWAYTRAAMRGQVPNAPDGDPVTDTAGGVTKPGKPVSGFEAMNAGEQAVFWLLYIAAILAIIPQGLVSIGHLATDSGVTSWFAALHMPTHLQWPTAIGFIVLGLALAGVATLIYLRAQRRERRRLGQNPGGNL